MRGLWEDPDEEFEGLREAGGVQGGGGVSARGLQSQKQKGTLEENRGSRSCRGPQSAEPALGAGGAPSHPVSPPPPTAAQARPNLLLLCSLSSSCSGSAETAGREVSSTLLHRRPDTHPVPSGVPESPHPCLHPQSQPCPASGETAVPKPWCASGLGSWGPREVARGRDLTSPIAPRHLRGDRLGGIFKGQDSHPPLPKPHSSPSASVSLEGKGCS